MIIQTEIKIKLKKKIANYNPGLETIVFSIPRNISTDVTSYDFLASLSSKTKSLKNENIIFDFVLTVYFDHNVCAILGAIIYELKSRNNSISVHLHDDDVEDSFKKNKFFEVFLNENVYPISTIGYQTIPCAIFNNNELKTFATYIDDSFLSMAALPTMSEGVKKKIKEGMLEIFVNAFEHGDCNYIYTSGGVSRSGNMQFTICNYGTTIRKNVSSFHESNKSAVEAIEWAVIKGNTTRLGNIPGGLGLNVIREFLRLNLGKIQIISCAGIWEENKGTIFVKSLKHRFHGTIVTLAVNINDTNRYILATEPEHNGF